MPGRRYGVTCARRDGREYVTLDSLVSYRGQIPLWKVLDATWLPPTPDSLAFSPWCAYDRQHDPGDDADIMGIAVPENAQSMSKVLFALRADTVTRRFAVVTTSGLRCFDQAYGVD